MTPIHYRKLAEVELVDRSARHIAYDKLSAGFQRHP